MAVTQYKKRAREDINRFAGKWVAFLGQDIIDDAETLPQLLAKVKRRKLGRRPSVMLVPRKDEGPYILIVL